MRAILSRSSSPIRSPTHRPTKPTFTLPPTLTPPARPPSPQVTRRRKLLEYLLREDLPEFKRVTSELGIRTNQLLKPKLAGARGRRI